MAAFTPILRALDAEKFAEIFAAAPRRGRERLLARHRVSLPAARGLPRPGARLRAGGEALRQRLHEVEDEPMAEELLRTWLLGRRPLLAAALDHLGLPHHEGLTDSPEVERIARLDAAALDRLLAALAPHGPRLDAAIYLAFMGASAPLLGGPPPAATAE